MEKYICKRNYSSISGARFYKGEIYNVGVMYFQYREVFHLNGMRSYVDNKIFMDYFTKYNDIELEIDRLFNIIMDG